MDLLACGETNGDGKRLEGYGLVQNHSQSPASKAENLQVNFTKEVVSKKTLRKTREAHVEMEEAKEDVAQDLANALSPLRPTA